MEIIKILKDTSQIASPPAGLEPAITVPKTVVISISPQGHGINHIGIMNILKDVLKLS